MLEEVFGTRLNETPAGLPGRRRRPSGSCWRPPGSGRTCSPNNAGQLRQPVCVLRAAARGAHRPADAVGRIHQAVEGQHAQRAPGTRNGLAACPAHDVTFDTGLLTVNGGLPIRVARSLAQATASDPLARRTTGDFRCGRRCCCCCLPALRCMPASTSTGTAEDLRRMTRHGGRMLQPRA